MRLPAATLDDAGTVAAYKSLALVERAFRSLKTVDLQSGRSITGSAPASAPMCSCACSAITSNGTCAPGWRQCSMMTTTARPPPPSAPASSPKRHARRPQAKQTHGLTDDGLPVHSFASLLVVLATLTRNEVATAAPDIVLTLYARPTAMQQKAFDLLAIDPACTQ
ncbi:MAG: hypothetical protein ACM30D_05670 [Hyphomicrobiales bacterium]